MVDSTADDASDDAPADTPIQTPVAPKFPEQTYRDKATTPNSDDSDDSTSS